jgi:hypothetical protein
MIIACMPLIRKFWVKAEHRHRSFLLAWFVTNLLLRLSFFAAFYAIAWEYSTQRYLKGFSDAVIPAAASPEEKVQAILDWMAHGPARLRSGLVGSAQDRDPTDKLNYDSLLRVCSTATNAFINLAASGGLPARRILLLKLGPGRKARRCRGARATTVTVQAVQALYECRLTSGPHVAGQIRETIGRFLSGGPCWWPYSASLR